METLCCSVGALENTSYDIETFLLVFTEIALGCEQLNYPITRTETSFPCFTHDSDFTLKTKVNFRKLECSFFFPLAV